MNKRFKPDAYAFIGLGLTRRILLFSAITFFISIIAFQYATEILIPVLIVYTLLIGYTVTNRIIAYKKEEYEFTKTQLIKRSGSIFSTHETIIQYSQITHVSRLRPFIENKLLDTEYVYVQTAGSRDAELVFHSIPEEYKVFAFVQKFMRDNGFLLTYKNRFLQTQPSTIGIFIELFSMFFGTVVGLVFFVVSLGPIVTSFLWQFKNNPFIAGLVLVFFVLGFFGVLVTFVFKFLDKKMRRYEIYEDTITYSEGFLSRHESIIPMENISDARVDKSITDRLLGLATVAISCKGQGQEIVFAHMKHARQIEDLISTTVTHTDADEGVIRMHALRSILPQIPLLVVSIFFPPLFFATIPAAYRSISRLIGTRFYVTSNGVKETFSFIKKFDREFVEKQITGVEITESPVDMLFGTYSITFWSLGSDVPIAFTNIAKDDALLEQILDKYSSSKTKQIPAQWSIKRFVLSKIFVYPVLLFGCIFTIVLSAVSISFIFFTVPILFLTAIWPMFDWLQYRNAICHVSSKHIIYQKGTLWKRFVYTSFTKIKSSTYIKYPLSQSGILSLDVAGETRNEKMSISNTVAMPYTPYVLLEADKMDKHLGITKKELVFSAKPQYRNTLLSLAFPPFWPLIPFRIWSLSKQTFIIEKQRLIHKYGIFYKSQKTIMMHKVDHIQKSQRAVEKVCQNGSIFVFTTGSSSVDMVIGPIESYDQAQKYLAAHVSDS